MAAALAAIGKLVDRLGDMLEWDADTREEWRQALGPLLPPAACGIWPRAARCLYELQRIPADCSREVYAVELPEYLRTLGRRPIRRHLPHARPVMVLMAFRKAHKQLLRGGLGEAEQLRIDRLMHHEMHRREHVIRHEFTPIIVSAITAAGLVPANRVEEVARDKLVAELLDRVCERGYLRIGDLRDSVARNQLRLPDLAGVSEFFGGDALCARRHAVGLLARRCVPPRRVLPAVDSALCLGVFWDQVGPRTDALHRPALRRRVPLADVRGRTATHGFQTRQDRRALSRAQGSRRQSTDDASCPGANTGHTGGAGTRTCAATGSTRRTPEPGDWQFDEDTLEFYWDAPEPLPPPTPIAAIVKEQRERASFVQDVFTSSEPGKNPDKPHHGSVLIQWYTIVSFGVFLLLVFHVPPLRRVVFHALRYIWMVIRGVLWDIPKGIWQSQTMRSLRLSGTARFLHRHFASPLLLSLLTLGIAFILGIPLGYLVWWGWTVFLGLLIAYNTPWGWEFQDRISEAISDWWRRVRTNFLPGFFGAIIDVFRMLANWVERQLYAVDEWMRFRSGDSQSSLALKACLGLVWFPIAYIFRFVFYLLVEPQVNPVKHFPVVTVSHKVIWPMVPQIAEWTGWTIGQVSMVVNGVPGIFGFLAWELMENWRLYAANRAAALKPVTVGSHGESMRGLLRPGFHSVTVPKLHRKIRKAIAADNRAKVIRHHHELEHAAEGVHRFAERELVPLLAGSPDWGGIPVEVTEVRFGVQRVEVEFAAPSLGRDPFVLAFENVGGLIAASITANGWADKLTDAQRAVFCFALRGLLDMSASVRYDLFSRTPDAPDEPNFACLARQVTWEEWVQRWGKKSEAAKG